MNSLRRGASSLLGRQGAKPTPAPQTERSLPKTFLCGDANEMQDRRHLLHQEAVAGLMQNYVTSLSAAFDNVAQIHCVLAESLQRTGDLVAANWVTQISSLSEGLQQYAQSVRKEVEEVMQKLVEAHEEHLRTARLLVHADRALKRREHYESKVGQLKSRVESATAGLGSNALDPEAVSNGRARRSYSGMKVMQADMKLGRLVRNEEKLKRMVDRHEQIDAEAATALERTLTVVRRRLRDTCNDLMGRILDDFLPGIQKVVNAAKSLVSPSRKSLPSLCAFAVGERVTITGLSSAAHHNDKTAIVRHLQEDGRIQVELTSNAGYSADQRKTLAVMPQNLCRCPQPEGPCSDTATSEMLITGSDWLCITDLQLEIGTNSDDSSDGTSTM